MIITIDGPAGSGKSTVARKLAARLGIAYLDTGAMYRALALAALEAGTPLDDAPALLATAQQAVLELDCGPTHTRVRLNGRDVSEAIRGMKVSEATSHVARHQGIRRMLVQRQRDIARALGSCVSEGRDQGSVVFPDADARFVLDAQLERRAQRRFQEMVVEGEEEVTLDQVLDNLRKRDTVDARQWESLLTSREAIVIDTSDMTIQEVVDTLAAVLQAGAPRPPAPATQPESEPESKSSSASKPCCST